VLRLIREDGVATRTDLARLTGLSRPAVTQRVNELITRGLVIERADGPSTGGRPPVRLEFNASGGAVLAASLGYSHGHIAVCDLTGEILALDDFRLAAERGPGEVLPALLDRWTALLGAAGLEEKHVRGVAIGLPGIVEPDEEDPSFQEPPGLPRWVGAAIAPVVAERFPVPVFLDNDVNVMALGEYRAHRAEGITDMLLVKLSTGIGAGLITGGRIQRGALGAAGEIGHIPIPDASGVLCRCGNEGCVEAVAGGTALLERARDRYPELADLPELTRLAHSGDPAIVALVREAGRRIGEVVAAAVNLLNPAVVVLAGDLSAAYDPLVAGVRATVYQRATALATRRLRIEPSRLGDNAGLIGCAMLALDRVLSPEAIDAT